MRALIVAALLAALTLAGPSPAAAQSRNALSANPMSLGLHIGLVTVSSTAAFALELPFEYTFPAGPGELAPHIGFMLAATDGFVALVFPVGVRYKIRLLSSHPFYAWPMFDIGPGFNTSGGGGAFGYIRAGGGLSYLVHPNVELIFQPLGLGAAFGEGGGSFSYNLMFGANFRF